MDTADIEDPDPTINIPIAPTSTPPVPPDCSATLDGADADAFMADFDDPEAFYASGAKDKVLADLQGAMRSTHNLSETLNLWSHQATASMRMLLTCSSLSYYRLFTQSPRLVSSSMHWLLDPRLNPLLSVPLLRASAPRPHQLLPPHHHPTPPDLGLCPAPLMPPLTLPASAAWSRRPKKRKGAAAAQAGLVQMAKSFLSAPPAAIVHTQQVVSGAAIVAPSNSERAKARRKWPLP
jgi:hypothetical protein